MRVEQIAHLLGRGVGQALGLALELAQLLDRDRDGGGEAGALLVDGIRLDAVLGNRLIEMVADMGGADGDSGRYRYAVKGMLLGEAALGPIGRQAIVLSRLILHRSRR